MASHTQYGQTLFLENLHGAVPAHLPRVHFTKTLEQSEAYDEAWLQELIMRQPTLLPVDQIEPLFADLVPICTELPLPSGFLDNLMVTPSGDIALIECKLWRNPEARREVIAQIIDYAKDLAKWNYERLEEAIKRTRDASPDKGPRGLYRRVTESEGSEEAQDLDEPSFIDAVSRNLKRGRFLLLIIGDGIREGVESMTEFLQQHAGLHFTLGLIEVALFRLPSGSFVVQPRLLLRTTNIDRGIVTIDASGVSIGPPREIERSPAVTGKSMTMTEEHYLELLEKTNRGVSPRLSMFVDKLADYGVTVEYGKRTMILRWSPDGNKSWNFGVFTSNGDLQLDYLAHRLIDLEHFDWHLRYLEEIAALVPGASIRRTPSLASWYVTHNGKCVKISALLQDDVRLEGWLRAIGKLQSDVRAVSGND